MQKMHNQLPLRSNLQRIFILIEIGTVFFYPTQWKIVSYVDLKLTQRLWKQFKTHQSQIAVYCNKVKNATWYSLTDCDSFNPYIKTKTRYIEQLRDVISDYLVSSTERSKRGLLDVGGDILTFRNRASYI
jgi:hypothetical protein